MTRFSATYFIPGADLIWGVLTLLQVCNTTLASSKSFVFTTCSEC